MKVAAIALAILAGIVFLSRNALLYRGASGGHGSLMSVALTIGADADKYSSDGNTPILAAAAARQTAAVERLIAAGANVNAENRQTGATPLMIAATLGDEPMIDALLAAGASVSSRDRDGHTAYWHAFRNHQLEVAGKVHYVRTVEVKLPTRAVASMSEASPSPTSTSDWVDGKPPNYVEPETDGSQLTITDTTGWTRIGPNQYVKSVTSEESAEMDRERRRQQDAARTEARRKMDATATSPP
jgi:hypothetical protein